MKILEQMNDLKLAANKIEFAKLPGLEVVEKELFNSLADSKGTIRDMCSHILNAGGKRVRPLLVIYSGLIFSEPSDELIYAAVAAELIHMASLVHDDIIDCSSLRRNRPSINSIWGNHFAVLCGDYLFAKAFGLLSSNRLNRSMDYMVQAIDNMCHGEIDQAADRFKCNIDMDNYYSKISKKTAIFLNCCCKSGAVVSGAKDSEIDLVGEYGLHVGLAFQIMDDILDFIGDPHTMGKPKMEDLRQGNITLPIILLLNSKLYGEWIREVIRKGEYDVATTERIIAVLNEAGIIDQCSDIMMSHIDKAKQCLELLPKSQYTVFLNTLAALIGARAN